MQKVAQAFSPCKGVLPGRLCKAAIRLSVVVLLAGFVCAALVRYSPGFESDETELDTRLSAETAAAIRHRAGTDDDLIRFSARYVARAAHGDWGVSRVFNAPVAGLLRERAAATAKLMGEGTALAWSVGVALAWLAVWPRRRALQIGASVVAGIALAIPVAVVAIAFFLIEAPLSLALALAIIPRVFGTMRELLEDAWQSPAVLCARARGVSPLELALRYVIAPILPQIAALVGVSTVLAFGAAIPIEALCDVAGIGQLAWRAALGRDLPVLCALAFGVTFAVALAQEAGDLFSGRRLSVEAERS